jgi:hypothetical protein
MVLCPSRDDVFLKWQKENLLIRQFILTVQPPQCHFRAASIFIRQCL